MFQPNVNEQLVIDNETYSIMEHPIFKGIPFGQTGRQGVVYLIADSKQQQFALKVINTSLTNPSLTKLTDNMRNYARIKGMSACNRNMIVPNKHDELLGQHPELLYSTLMPWIPGPTWAEILIDKKPLTREESLKLARGLVSVLVDLEQNGIAHCDLSAANVMMPILADQQGGFSDVELVDLEQLYGDSFTRPHFLVAGTQGYTSSALAEKGLWNMYSDRFSGAILIAEMLAWPDAEVREKACDDSYFEPAELQQSGAKIDLLLSKLADQWGTKVVELVERAWNSNELSLCPTFGEWHIALRQLTNQTQSAVVTPAQPTLDQSGKIQQSQKTDGSKIWDAIREIRDVESSGNVDAALDMYAALLTGLSPKHEAYPEIEAAIRDLEKKKTVSNEVPESEETKRVEQKNKPNQVTSSLQAEDKRKKLIMVSAIAIGVAVVGSGIFALRGGPSKETQTKQEPQAIVKAPETPVVTQPTEETLPDPNTIAVETPIDPTIVGDSMALIDETQVVDSGSPLVPISTPLASTPIQTNVPQQDPHKKQQSNQPGNATTPTYAQQPTSADPVPQQVASPPESAPAPVQKPATATGTAPKNISLLNSGSVRIDKTGVSVGGSITSNFFNSPTGIVRATLNEGITGRFRASVSISNIENAKATVNFSVNGASQTVVVSNDRPTASVNIAKEDIRNIVVTITNGGSNDAVVTVSNLTVSSN